MDHVSSMLGTILRMFSNHTATDTEVVVTPCLTSAAPEQMVKSLVRHYGRSPDYSMERCCRLCSMCPSMCMAYVI